MSKVSTRNLRLLAIILFTFPLLLNAQIQIPNTPQAQRYKDLIVADVPVAQMPTIDLDELQKEDEEDEAAGLPPRFGKRFNVDLNLGNSGRWDNLPNGGRIWRLAIESQDAISLNLTYSDFFMPKGAQMFIFTEDFSQILGAFSPANNKPDGKFATNLIFDQKIIIGYYEPRASRGQGRIAIDGVVHGYRNINVPEFDKSKFNLVQEEGNTFTDILCANENWEEQIRSVSVAIVGGGNRWCTGALVANTMRDERLLFLTANNCLAGLDDTTEAFDAISNPELPYWIFQWNYQKNLCNGSIPNINSSTTGARVLANSAPNAELDGSNFALVELTENPVRAGFDVFFSGWDATGDTPQASTSIHHPNGAPKKISTNNSPLSSSTTNEVEGGSDSETTHWKVANWNQGEIDNASKGAPLFDPTTQNIIGQFSGISNDEQSDHFGQLAYSWLNNNASDQRRRLRDWLDPMNSGVMKFNGVPENNDCSNPEMITCDATVAGDNNNGLANNFTNYSGLIQPQLAKEYIYSFIPNTTGLITLPPINWTAK